MVRRMTPHTGIEWADDRVAAALDEENAGPEAAYAAVVRRALQAGGLQADGERTGNEGRLCQEGCSDQV